MNLLAFDTSTESLSVAVTGGGLARGRVLAHEGVGGARASADLLPVVLRLLGEAGMRMSALQAIVFGCGPGSFTGLRTACAVAQGLAFGAGVPVLPMSTLMTLAEVARERHGLTKAVAVLDARMGEVYWAQYEFAGTAWRAITSPALSRPQDVDVPVGWSLVGTGGPLCVAQGVASSCLDAVPEAAAMLRLAPGLLAAGQGMPAEQALPLYLRDKVAQTTQERAAARAAVAGTEAPG